MINNNIGTGNINLVDCETLKRIVHEVLTDVSSVASTLGPGGKAKLVHDSNTTGLYQSKDGYRLVMDMHYDDYFYDALLKIIKDASSHNNQIIGDGTTSAEVILNEFYKNIESLVEKHEGGFQFVSSTGVVNILETLKTVLKEKLIEKKYVRFIQDYPIEDQKKIITKIASIAANNDHTIGEYVSKFFDKIVESGRKEKLFVDITPNYSKDNSESSEIGFRMGHSYINRIFSTEPDGQTAKYDEPRYLLIEGAILDSDIEKIEPIIQYVCLQNNRPLVIIAADYTNKVSQYLYTLRIGGAPLVVQDEKGNQRKIVTPPLPILPIQINAGDDASHAKYVDLEVSLGAHAIPAVTETWESLGTTPIEWEKILGGSEKIVCIPFETSIINGYGETSVIDARVKTLQEELDHMVLITDGGASELRKADYQERISMLKSNMLSIRVGGATFKERQYNCLVYEDAFCAVNSTIQNGFTLAGQVSVNHLIANYSDEIVEATIDKLQKEGRNVTYGSKRTQSLKDAINQILSVINDTIGTAYSIALHNAIFDEKYITHIKETIYSNELKDPLSYNLMTDAFEGIELGSDCNMLVAGNTDYETIAAIIGITNILLNSDGLETLYIPRRATREEIEASKKSN